MIDKNKVFGPSLLEKEKKILNRFCGVWLNKKITANGCDVIFVETGYALDL